MINTNALRQTLLELLAIPSPTGRTEALAKHVESRLQSLKLKTHRSRQGALIAHLNESPTSDRPVSHNAPITTAVATHLDTLGAMVSDIAANGRPRLTPLGSWSARMAAGARISVFSDEKNGEERETRGTVLPLKASGHRYAGQVDSQPSDWDHLEVRLDIDTHSRAETQGAGINIGDFVTFDAQPEFLPNGYLNARFLDNKAAVAIVITVLEALRQQGLNAQGNWQFIFPVSEEVGTGSGHLVGPEVDDLMAIDIAILAPDQHAHPKGVTLVAKDRGGPYNRALLNELKATCHREQIPHSCDIFRHYYSDTHPALLAGADCRHALIAFACDSSHGWERTHMDSLVATATLLLQRMLEQKT